MQCPLCQHARTRVCDSRSLLSANASSSSASSSASSSSSSASSSTRRKRECLSCGASFFTLERAESGYDARNLWVLKNDGGEERFDANKLTASLRACLALSQGNNKGRDNERREKEIIASLSDKICDTLQGGASHRGGASHGGGANDGSARMRITSRALDLSARRFLREHDFASYVRYASVSGGFRGLDDFTDFLATERATTQAGTNPSERK